MWCQAYVYGCGFTGELSDWRRLWRKACQADGVADLSANEDTGETPIPPVVHRPTIVMTPADVPSTSDRTFWTTTKTAFGPTAAVDNGAPGITVDTTVPGTTTVKTGGEMPPPTGGGEGMAALLRLFVEHYSRDRDVMQRVTDPTTPDAMYTALSLCTTPEDVMQEMRDLCADRGLNWDALEDRSRQVYPISAETFAQVLSGDELPTTEWLHIFLRACGIPEERTPIWHHTVARIKIAQLRHRRPPVQLVVEQPAEPAQQTVPDGSSRSGAGCS